MLGNNTSSERLKDIVFLIQYLGLGGEYSLRNESKADGRQPVSAKNWTELALQHQEFFRVTDSKSVTLAARYMARTGENGAPEPLSIDQVQFLIESAIKIHERTVRAQEAWIGIGTLVCSGIAALTGVVLLFVS